MEDVKIIITDIKKKPVLNIKELAENLGVSVPLIRRLVRHKKIPVMRLGYRTLRFNAREVYMALANPPQ